VILASDPAQKDPVRLYWQRRLFASGGDTFGRGAKRIAKAAEPDSPVHRLLHVVRPADDEATSE
jgi:hypothetical protein